MTAQLIPARISKGISPETLGSLVTYLEIFAQGDFRMGFEDGDMVVRFAHARDKQLLRQQFPDLLEPLR